MIKLIDCYDQSSSKRKNRYYSLIKTKMIDKFYMKTGLKIGVSLEYTLPKSVVCFQIGWHNTEKQVYIYLKNKREVPKWDIKHVNFGKMTE